LDKRFTIDARIVLTLGRESIRDQTTAVLELVKNSYDADATRVDIDIHLAKNYLRIRDNGSGMSETEVEAKWLRIGYSAKRTQKVSPILGRRTTGEKGIGRISADRLGRALVLISAPPTGEPTGLRVDWDAFEKDDLGLHAIPVEGISHPRFQHDNESPRLAAAKMPAWSYPDQGTEVTASPLRPGWNFDTVARLRKELAAFLPPFHESEDFEIFLLTDLSPDLCGKVETRLPASAAIDLDAHIDVEGHLTYTVTRNVAPKTKETGAIDAARLVQGSLPLESAPLGPVEIRLLFYPRKSETSLLANISLSSLREFLDDYSGVRIYRDGIRVKPYGDPTDQGGDWLLLGERKSREPAGAARPTFKVAQNQLVGAVFIGRDRNPSVIDSSAREGLIRNPAFQRLRDVTLACVNLVETAYHQAHQERAELHPRKEVRLAVDELSKRLVGLASTLAEARQALPTSAGIVAQRTSGEISEALKAIQSTNRSLEELASQATIYRGLATTGIAATVFGHETQSSLSQVEGSVTAAQLLLSATPPDVRSAVEELKKAEKYAARVGSWGSFALVRVQRDKRKRQRVDLVDLVDTLTSEIKPVFDAIDAQLLTDLEAVSGRTFAMDIESILINLLTNAYTACQQTTNPRVIQVTLRPERRGTREGANLTVEDSGPGVASEFIERIWEPLFSTKSIADGRQAGTGLGLAIVSSIVEELDGVRSVENASSLPGARFRVWVPLG
jgi:hypothetical protein